MKLCLSQFVKMKLQYCFSIKYKYSQNFLVTDVVFFIDEVCDSDDRSLHSLQLKSTFRVSPTGELMLLFIM